MPNILNFGGSGKPSSSLVATLTAEPAHVLNGKTFIGKDNREVQTGTIPTITLPTSAASSATSGYTSKATIGRSTSAQYINIPPGYNETGGYYTVSGTPLGTVITPTGKSATATVTTLKYTYNSTNSNFTVAHNTQASATVSVTPSVTTAGYLSSTEGTKTANNVTAYGQVNATVAKIAGSVSISGTKTYKPSITRSAFTISGVTDGASGAATTTAPTSGVYVKVSSAANTGNVTGAVTISTAGYGTSSYHGITGSGNVAVGASASDATYVPIKEVENIYFDGGNITDASTNLSGTNVTFSDTDNGISVYAFPSFTRQAVLFDGAVNGWVSKSDGDIVLGTAYINIPRETKYITKIVVPKDKVFTVEATADTALDTTSDITVTNKAYRHIKVSNPANGSTTITNSGLAYVNAASATAGSLTVNAYNSSGTAENDKSVVTNGKWVQNTVTPTTSAQGPFYGRTTVNAVSLTGTAVAADVLADKTFYNTSLSKVTGTMPNRSIVDSTIGGINSSYPNVPIHVGTAQQMGTGTVNGTKYLCICPPIGYWPGNGTAYVGVTASSFGDAAVENVLSGKKFTSSNGINLTGTMLNKGAISKVAPYSETINGYVTTINVERLVAAACGTGSANSGTWYTLIASSDFKSSSYTVNYTLTINDSSTRGGYIQIDGSTNNSSWTNAIAKVTSTSAGYTQVGTGTVTGYRYYRVRYYYSSDTYPNQSIGRSAALWV